MDNQYYGFLPKALRYDMKHLLFFTFADSLNSFLFLIQSTEFSVYRMMRWTIFAKLFYVAYLAVSLDDRLLELATCYLLTSLSLFVTARTCKSIIDERERLRPCGFADVYIILYIDVLY